MKRKIKFLIISCILVLCLSACSKQTEDSTDAITTEPNTTQTEPGQSVGFDIEVARKNIIIKGQPFEIPVALGDLKDGWTWKENENSHYATDGGGSVDLFYNGEEWFSAGLENYYEGAENKGIIYNIAIKTDDCSIDGIVPCQTTKQEVLDKYGEPDEVIQEYSVYRYGTTHNGTNYSLAPTKEQRITIAFDENDIVSSISITYDVLDEY